MTYTCERCSEEFEPNGPQQVYCGKECRIKAFSGRNSRVFQVDRWTKEDEPFGQVRW